MTLTKESFIWALQAAVRHFHQANGWGIALSTFAVLGVRRAISGCTR